MTNRTLQDDIVLTWVEPKGGVVTAWPNQVAIIMRDGRITDVFTEGTRRVGLGFLPSGRVQAFIAYTVPFSLTFRLEDEYGLSEWEDGIPLQGVVLTADGRTVTAQFGLTFSIVPDKVDLLLRLSPTGRPIKPSDIGNAIKGELLAKVLTLDIRSYTASDLRGNETLLRSLYDSLRRELHSTLSGYGLQLDNFYANWGLTDPEGDRLGELQHQQRLREIERQQELHRKLREDEERREEQRRFEKARLQEQTLLQENARLEEAARVKEEARLREEGLLREKIRLEEMVRFHGLMETTESLQNNYTASPKADSWKEWREREEARQRERDENAEEHLKRQERLDEEKTNESRRRRLFRNLLHRLSLRNITPVLTPREDRWLTFPSYIAGAVYLVSYEFEEATLSLRVEHDDVDYNNHFFDRLAEHRYQLEAAIGPMCWDQRYRSTGFDIGVTFRGSEAEDCIVWTLPKLKTVMDPLLWELAIDLRDERLVTSLAAKGLTACYREQGGVAISTNLPWVSYIGLPSSTVVLYLRHTDHSKNVNLFDELQEHRETIESELGELLWVRETGNSSLIISINGFDAPRSLEWVANTLCAFKRVFDPLLEKMSHE